MEALNAQIGQLEVESASLKASVQESCTSEEALEKEMKRLRTGWMEEETKRKELSNMMTQTIQSKATENLNLSKEVELMKISSENEKNEKIDLENKVAQLGQIIALGQQALQQERMTVDLLKNTIESLEADNKRKTMAAVQKSKALNDGSNEIKKKEDIKSVENSNVVKNSSDEKVEDTEKCKETKKVTIDVPSITTAEKDQLVEKLEPTKTPTTAATPSKETQSTTSTPSTTKSASRNNTLKKKKKKTKHVF